MNDTSEAGLYFVLSVCLFVVCLSLLLSCFSVYVCLFACLSVNCLCFYSFILLPFVHLLTINFVLSLCFCLFAVSCSTWSRNKIIVGGRIHEMV